MAKIAVELERALARRIVEGAAGRTTPRVIARGDGWSVADVICTSGPQDHSFEEQHSHFSVALVAPHQYVLRARLREAALRLTAAPGKVLDLALDCGFGDVSNFNRAFRAEFGVSPRQYRRASASG